MIAETITASVTVGIFVLMCGALYYLDKINEGLNAERIRKLKAIKEMIN